MLERRRKPDYFIGSNGKPAMESAWVNLSTYRLPVIPNKAHIEAMAVRNFKTVKCLNNKVIQNGRDIHTSIPQALSSSKTGSSNTSKTDSRRWHDTNVCEITSITSTNIRCATRQSSVVSKIPSPVLLRNRGIISHYINHNSTSTSSNTSHHATGSLAVPVLSKCSTLRTQLDNRLSYQRSYDRNIFGFTKKTEQVVLPPLPN
uniref:Uncharacterized protein n=1 Tax=Anopheles albimanus TaxID=7167 RepID=A0A182FWW5_ANOAL